MGTLGQRLWSAAATGGTISSSAAVTDSTVYLGSGDGKLFVFAAAGCGAETCEPLWTASTGGPVRSSPAVADDLVFVGSDDGNLYALAAQGCKKKATCRPR